MLKLHLPPCTAECHRPCSELYYKPTVFSSLWFTDAQNKYFYDEVIKDAPFAWRFSTNESGTQEIAHTQKELDELISLNFLKVNVFLGDNTYISFEDSPKFTVANLLSQIGGTLNLWAGISVVIIVEVIELLLKLCGSEESKNTEKGRNNPTNAAI